MVLVIELARHRKEMALERGPELADLSNVTAFALVEARSGPAFVAASAARVGGAGDLGARAMAALARLAPVTGVREANGVLGIALRPLGPGRSGVLLGWRASVCVTDQTDCPLTLIARRGWALALVEATVTAREAGRMIVAAWSAAVIELVTRGANGLGGGRHRHLGLVIEMVEAGRRGRRLRPNLRGHGEREDDSSGDGDSAAHLEVSLRQ